MGIEMHYGIRKTCSRRAKEDDRDTRQRVKCGQEKKARHPVGMRERRERERRERGGATAAAGDAANDVLPILVLPPEGFLQIPDLCCIVPDSRKRLRLGRVHYPRQPISRTGGKRKNKKQGLQK